MLNEFVNVNYDVLFCLVYHIDR